MPHKVIDDVPVWGDPVDESALKQIQNCRKGATRVALMGDHHKGYAVPIGGVVAYEGKISPSGVGYDIACLEAGTRVTSRDGYWLPIEAVGHRESILCWDDERVRPVSSCFGSIEKGVKACLAIELINGRTIRCTPDHRIFTHDGWRRADALDSGDCVAAQPFIGLPHEPVGHRVLDLISDAEARDQVAAWAASGRLPALLRLLGVLSGDGHLSRDGKRISVYTTDGDGAERVAEDFAVFASKVSISRRLRRQGYRPELNVYITSKHLHRTLALLGCPVGKKDWPASPMPWLFALPAWLRANFLSGFASAEMMTPRILPLHMPNLQIKQACDSERPHAARWIADLLESLCFTASVAPSGEARENRRGYVVQILGGGAEQLRFIEQVGFCYSREKRVASARAASFWWSHREVVRNRELARDDARALKDQGVHFRTIMSDVAARYGVGGGFIYHAIYDSRGSPRRSSGIEIEPDTTGEICWVPVRSVSPCGDKPTFDIVTDDPAHRFFGEGIVIHNCGNKAVLTDADAGEIRAKLKTIMDDVWKSLSFGIGLNNKEERVDHELFDDSAWKIHPMPSLKEMARNQLGTVGSGNHYVDIFEDERGRIWIGVHFGSRGLGHKTATHFLKAGGARDGMDIDPLILDADSPLGSDYLACMNLAGRYAYAGRDWVCDRVLRLLGARAVEEVHNHHNFAWREHHGGRDLWVVRKGATPAFPGQKGFVGGSMGDISVILEGIDSEEAKTSLHSTVHGAGRVMSRTAARGKVHFRTGRVLSPGSITRRMMMNWVTEQGVELRGAGTDESPHCYKRLPEVLAHHEGTIRILHTLQPIGVAMAGENEVDPYKD